MAQTHPPRSNLNLPEKEPTSSSARSVLNPALLAENTAMSEGSLEQWRLKMLYCLKSRFLLPLLEVLIAILSLLGIIDGLLRLMIAGTVTYGKELTPILPGPGWLGSLVCGAVALGLWYLENLLTRDDRLYQQQAQQALEIELPLARIKLGKALREQERLESKLQQIRSELKAEQGLNQMTHSKIIELELALKNEKDNHTNTSQNLSLAQTKNRELEEKVAQALLRADRAEATASNKVLPVVQKIRENLSLVEWAESELKKMSQRNTNSGNSRSNDNGNGDQPESKESALSSIPAKKPVASTLKGNRNYLGGA